MKISKILKEVAIIVTIAIVITILIRIFFIEAYSIDGSSMNPTFSHRDELIVSKIGSGPNIPILNIGLPVFSHPQKGDIVVFQSIDYEKPEWHQELLDFLTLGRINFNWKRNNDKMIIKRVIASAGDVIQIVNNTSQQIYINGKMLERNFYGCSKRTGMAIYKERNGVREYTIQYRGNTPLLFNFSYDESQELYIPKKGDILTLDKNGTDSIISIKINNKEMSDMWKILDCLDRINEESHDVDFYSFNGEKLVYTIKNNYYFVRGDNRDNSRDSTSWGILREDLIIGIPLIRIFPLNKFGTIK